MAEMWITIRVQNHIHKLNILTNYYGCTQPKVLLSVAYFSASELLYGL